MRNMTLVQVFQPLNGGPEQRHQEPAEMLRLPVPGVHRASCSVHRIREVTVAKGAQTPSALFCHFVLEAAVELNQRTAFFPEIHWGLGASL